MSKILTKGRIALSVIFSVLIIDQIIKIWIKTHMFWHESIRVTDWFYIYFTENNGMAFGMEIFGKLFLTSFRIVAVAFIGWFLYKFVKHGMKTGFIVCISLILTGALGEYYRQCILRSHLQRKHPCADCILYAGRRRICAVVLW